MKRSSAWACSAALSLAFSVSVAMASGATGAETAEAASTAAGGQPAPIIPRETIRRADGSTFKFASLRVAKPPRYPRRMADLGAEGWVVVSFVVQKDGTVRDAMAVDSSRREFERYAVNAVRDFIYSPAEVNGQPIEQGVTLFKITFALEPASDAARPDFVRRFRQIEREIERGELEKAAVALAHMESLGRLNLYEDAFYWWAQAMFHHARDEHRQRRASLRRAIAYGGRDDISVLPAALHRHALAQLYGEYVRTGELAAALDTYQQLIERAGPKNVSKDLQAHAANVRALLAGDGTLRAQGHIDDDRVWAHPLSRDGFEFADVIGRLERFSLWCEQRAVELEIDVDSSWQVPPSWGDCHLYVSGAPGTSFSLVEYASAAVE